MLRCLVIGLFAVTHYSLHVDALGRHQGCVMRGVCGRDEELYQNCLYSGPPVPVSLQNENKYKELCPRLFQDDNIALCCDDEQFEIMEKQMAVTKQMLSRCPSCFSNFVNLWCQFACSPYQKHFVSILETRGPDKYSINKNTSYVTGVEYFVNPDYAHGMFNSCKEVKSSQGDYSLSAMCGTNMESCTTEKLLSFLGTYSKTIGVPFNIKFVLTQTAQQRGNITMNYMNGTTYSCDSPSDMSSSSCSCLDCQLSCVNDQPFPNLDEESCRMASMDCGTAMTLLAFGAICISIMFIAVTHYVLKKSTGVPARDSPEFKAADGTENSVEDVGKFSIDEFIQRTCRAYSMMVVRRPAPWFFSFLCIAIIFSTGIVNINLTTDPVSLWSSPASEARQNRDYFGRTFRPFYRIEQIIIVPKDQSSFVRDDEEMNPIVVGPVFRKEFLSEAFRLQDKVLSLVAASNVTLEDICYKPLEPENNNCAVMSVFNYFQNNRSLLDRVVSDEFMDYDYFSHMAQCLSSPMTLLSKLQLSCFGAFGGPIQPEIVFGSYDEDVGRLSSRGLLITLALNNYMSPEDNKDALDWERTFIKFLRTVQSEYFTISFMAQRSIEDEIQRESTTDIFTVTLSYAFMFLYVSFALGQYQVSGNNLWSLFIHSKFVLGITGILLVALSVTSSIGIFAYGNVEATLIIFEVLPFLVLAVGVDNVFLLVQAYQRVSKVEIRSLEERIGEICAEVIPSMLLTNVSEAICFFLGALSPMPAVRTFSLYAGMAIVINFVLQTTCFLAVLVTDIKRQEDGRLELCCCVQLPNEPVNPESYMYTLFNRYYAPVLLKKIHLGLDQKMAVPEDSHVLTHFNYMDKHLNIGPPVFFVLKGSFDYSDPDLQSLVCTGAGCLPDSLGAQINRAARWPNTSFIAQSAANWLDAYIGWLRPSAKGRCCRLFNTTKEFCPSREVSDTCHSCDVEYVHNRPRSDLFYPYLQYFLDDNPSAYCPSGGKALFNTAVRMAEKSHRVVASHFMAYHSPLRTSRDFMKSMETTTFLANNITTTINRELSKLGHPPVRVFAHSEHYVFYEQYSSIVKAAIFQLICSAVCIFFVTTVLSNGDPWLAMIVVITVSCILINLMGVMYWWSIDFNAISVVNLVMSVGVSVEFCAHIVRAFACSTQDGRIERAREALSVIGCSVLSGITMTKFGGVIVLAFAHSQIFKVFYFRMFFSIVLIGATHGLMFLPVLLSFIGPPSASRPQIYALATITDNSGLKSKCSLRKPDYMGSFGEDASAQQLVTSECPTT